MNEFYCVLGILLTAPMLLALSVMLQERERIYD